MYEIPIEYALICVGAVSLVGVFLVFADKRRARTQHRRIREKTLMICGAVGGAAAMYFTMITLRHKTRRKKFMIGFPLMILAHALLVVWLWTGDLVMFLW